MADPLVEAKNISGVGAGAEIVLGKHGSRNSLLVFSITFKNYSIVNAFYITVILLLSEFIRKTKNFNYNVVLFTFKYIKVVI